MIVAKEFDSTVDVQANLNLLDSMVAEIRRMLAGRTTDMDKLLAVRMFQFDAGPWNGFQPFVYDIDDPFGINPKTKILSEYLRTRKGNCISMPMLTLALMERIDPNVQLFGSTAPGHVFCRYTDRQTKDAFNFEPTNGGNPARNEWMIGEFFISQKAVDKGTYLRNLKKTEFVALLLETLIVKACDSSDFSRALRYADLAIRIAPNFITSIRMKMRVEMMVHDRYCYMNQAWKLGEGRRLTSSEQQEWHELHVSVENALARIEKMGWVELTPEQEEQKARRYRETIEAEKERRRALANPD